MANSAGFVGVPKREPCRKCGNPVFFAERITFEQKLYHRSCLKCARCGAQLTLGSFYETETDGEYCCETCPDEEIQFAERRRSASSDDTKSSANNNKDNVRNSRSSKLLERISFFESAPLSDEEKTSNLVRRAKMNNFLQDSLVEDKLENGNESIKTVESDNSSVSEDESENEEAPPTPPLSEPPSLPIQANDSLTSSEVIEGDKSISRHLDPENIVDTQSRNSIKNDESLVSDTINVSASKDGAKSSSLNNLHDTAEQNEVVTDVAPEVTPAATNVTSEAENLVQNENTSETNEQKDIVGASIDRAIDDKDLFESMELKDDEIDDLVETNEVDKEGVTASVQEEVPMTENSDDKAALENEVPKNCMEIEEITANDTSIASSKTSEDINLDKVESKPIIKEEYPSDLNPFGDDSDEEQRIKSSKPVPTTRRVSTNPFGSEDEDESLPVNNKPPRPPPPKIKPSVPANPFDDEAEDEPENEIVPVIVKPSPRRTPVPTPRKHHSHNDSISSMETSLMSSQFGGSNASLASSMESGPSSMTINRRKKSKAPDIPISLTKASTENLNVSSNHLTTPRKKRPAPAPPIQSSTPKQTSSQSSSPNPTQRLITLDASLISNDSDFSEPITRAASNDSVVYRRTIVPLKVDDDSISLETSTSERQVEKMKDNKEAQNRNRQSQTSPTSSGNDSYNSLISNKSQQGKWKRRKGPAPALPVPLPVRKTIKMLPLKEIRQELDIIETQQQGLEKQGVILEQMIRERCEGVDSEVDITGIQTNSKEVEDLIMQLFELVNEKNELFRRQAELMYLRRQHRLEQEQADLEYEIRLLMAQPERNKTDSDKEKEEALIARLVEIVQMRNEVVDCLEMDRLREAEEDMSIKQSIEERAANQYKQHVKKDSDTEKSTTGDSSMKLSKKEKKRLKEAKKLVKSKKIDSEKDADETESTTKEKKKKKKFFVDFLHHK